MQSISKGIEDTGLNQEKETDGEIETLKYFLFEK